MRIIGLAIVLLCLSCSQEKTNTISHLHSGKVFHDLPLLSPNSVRTGSGIPGKEYWQQTVDHRIKVSLNIDENLIEGSETITYTNNSPDSLSYIWLQLEQNIHTEESIRSREGRPTGEGEYRGIHISSLQIDSLDVKWDVYGTLAKIHLKRQLDPKESLQMEIVWSFPMPTKASLRMGYDSSYKDGPVWELAQWFPTPCVYDDVYGWNTLPYIGRGEFYTNFGDYYVEITVPDNHIVLASGSLTNPQEVLSSVAQEQLLKAMASDDSLTISKPEDRNTTSESRVTWIFEGENIRTFAWASSASFLWEAASVEIQLLDGSSTRVLCQVGYPIEESRIWNEAVSYLQHSIKYYSETLYPYPWPQISMARGKSGGMEYPMLVFCRGSSHASLFNVTDHEVGHNWFPMIVNTDERRHAWMDEGFNTFVNHYSLESFYGEKKHKPDVSKYIASKFMHDLKAINTPPDLLKSRRHLSYRKPGYGLRFLREEILGEERFDAAWKEYVHQWAFKSPRPADFYRIMENASGVNLQWFFRGFFEEPMQLDQSILNATQVEKNATWDVAITFQNNADWVCPVALLITCIDDSLHEYKLPVTIWAWSSIHKQTFSLPSKVMKIEIDPDKTYPDIDGDNNNWYF